MYHLTTIKADGTVENTEQDKCPSLKQLRDAVGGSIESVPFWDAFDGKRAWVICNSEGKLEEMPYNAKATYLWHFIIGGPSKVDNDVLVGDVMVIACDTDAEFRRL